MRPAITGQITPPPPPKPGGQRALTGARPPRPQGELATGQRELEPGQLMIRRAAAKRVSA